MALTLTKAHNCIVFYCYYWNPNVITSYLLISIVLIVNKLCIFSLNCSRVETFISLESYLACFSLSTGVVVATSVVISFHEDDSN